MTTKALTHMRLQRRCAVAVALVALGLCYIIAPCFAGESVNRSQTVTFTSEQMTPKISLKPNDMAKRKVLEAFLRQYPNYVVKPFVIPKVSGSSDTAALMGIASGQPPQAIYVNFRQSSTYIDHGFLTPLEELLARVLSNNPKMQETDSAGHWLANPTKKQIAAARQKLLSRVPQSIWPVVYRQANHKADGLPTGKHIWAMPTVPLVRALVYRKDLFREAGLDPRKPPRTWKQLMAYAQKISTLPNTIGMAIGGGGMPTVSFTTFNFFAANGVQYISQDKQGKWHAAFNTKKAAQTIYYLLRLTKQPFTIDGKKYYSAASMSSNGQAMELKWKRGQIGMKFTTLQFDLLSTLNPQVTGIAPMPVPPGGNPAGELNSQMMGIFSGTTPAQKIAIMQYIWFITGKKARRIKTKMMVNFGYGTFVNPNWLKEFGYDDVLAKVPKAWRKTFQRAVKYGVPEPYGQNTQFIYRKVSEPINWALTGAGSDLLKLPKAKALSYIQHHLDIAAKRVNQHMLGHLTSHQKKVHKIVGSIGFALVVLLFGIVIIWIWRAFKQEEIRYATNLDGKTRRWTKYFKAYSMLVPALLILFLWQYLPVIMGLPLALYDYELALPSHFVGIDNFANVLMDPRFWGSLGKTFYYAALVIGLGFWPPILVAILLDEIPTATAKYLFRTIYYLPAIISGVILVFLWLQFYQPNDKGYLNQIIMSANLLGPVAGTLLKLFFLGAWLSFITVLICVVIKLEQLTKIVRACVLLFTLALIGITLWPLISAYWPLTHLQSQALIAQGQNPAYFQGWLGVLTTLSHLIGSWHIQPLGWVHDPGLAMICVVIPMIWAASGPGCILYLAALKTVPHELVEAATIDGAGILQKIAYITLPRIKFLILIQFIAAVVGAFKGGVSFILAMTGGGPNGATRILDMDIFERTFMNLHFGTGAAMGWLLGVLIIGLTAYQLKRLSRAEFKTNNSA